MEDEVARWAGGGGANAIRPRASRRRGRFWEARAGLALAAALGALVWCPSMARAYRTLRDDPSLGLQGPARFPASVAWDLYVGDTDPAVSSAVEEIAVAAFDNWSTPSCTSFSTNYRGLASVTASRGDGRSSVVVVSSGWVAAGFPDGRGATTDVQLREDQSGNAEIREADIFLNFDQHRFALGRTPEGDELDLEGVLTHEVGHLAGLLHPCEHESADAPRCDEQFANRCMFPDYLGPSQRLLADDDVAGICALYPAVDASCPSGCPIGHDCVEGACVPSCVGCECDGGSSDGGCGQQLPACVSDDACPGRVCTVWGMHAGQCSMPGATGTRCSSGDECVSRLCLTSTSLGSSVCTTQCRVDTDCEPGAVCGLVDGDRVCAPPARPRTCAVGWSGGDASGAPVSMLAIAWLLVTRRALRARRRRSM